MSNFGLEFPQTVEARENFLETLSRLDIYKPEICWEDVIMDVYNRLGNMPQHIGSASNTLILPPNILEELKKSTK